MSTNTSTQAASRPDVRPAPPAAHLDRAEKIATILGRVLVAALFILAGAAKIIGPKPFLEHMAQFGVPSFLLPAVIALELGGGLAILVGWRVREAAGALAIFCVSTALIFHHQLSIKAETTLFLKDLAIAGGLFVLAASASARARTKGVAPG